MTARELVDQARRQAGSVFITRGFEMLAGLGLLDPRSDPARHGLERIRDIPYLPDGRNEHLLDVYRPKEAEGPLPVVLYLHGGSFRILSKETHWLMGLAFARHGFVVFNANYRLAPSHPFPAALEDVAAAYRYAIEQSRSWGGDPRRIVLAGESAGANLALALAIAACYRRPEPWAQSVFELGVVPEAVNPACGFLQVSDPERFGRRHKFSIFVQDRMDEVYEDYLAKATGGGPGGLEMADPLVVLEKAGPPDRPFPPVFSFAGTRDPILDDTRRLGAALDRLGVVHLERYYPGEIHAFHAFLFLPNAMAAWQETFDFLYSVMGPPVMMARQDGWLGAWKPWGLLQQRPIHSILRGGTTHPPPMPEFLPAGMEAEPGELESEEAEPDELDEAELGTPPPHGLSALEEKATHP